MLDLVPSPLILRFLLAPRDVACARITLELGGEFLARERVELLDTYNRDLVQLARPAFLQEIEIHLAAAEDDALDPLGIKLIDLRHDNLETAARQLFQPRGRQFMPQQALRRQDDQWAPERPQHLTPQHVKHLPRRSGYAHLNILFGAKLQKPFQSCR